MLNRILFVDDEPRVLDGLRRSLRSKRKDWELSFVSSGAEALEKIAEEPFDILISDVKMPGMNGVELLRIVAERNPEIVRIILTGYAEHDLSMKAVKIAHQYLTKPCESDHLIGIITRIFNLRKLMKNEDVISFVSSMKTIPSLPEFYKELIRELDSENTSIKRISEIISKDMGMSAKILQVVNSPFFSTYRTVSSPLQAASLLGLNTIRNLALSIHLFQAYEDKSSVFDYHRLWAHSMSVAELAKKIVADVGVDKEFEDHAFVSGMLHDIGKLIMAVEYPDTYAKVLQDAQESGIEIYEAEYREFGTGHQEVAAYLLGIWGIPDDIIEPIAFHHVPSNGYNTGFSPLAAVHIADAIVTTRTEAIGKMMQPDMNFLRNAKLEPLYKRWLEAEGA